MHVNFEEIMCCCILGIPLHLLVRRLIFLSINQSVYLAMYHELVGFFF
jgi:hypothetical protein